MPEKDYNIAIEIKFDVAVSASSRREALRMVKDIFKDENNIDLADSEIKSVIVNRKEDK